MLQWRSFHSTWQWAIKQRGFLDGFSCSPVTRAINAFSHLIRQELFQIEGYNNPEILFWALIGIEALYAKGKTGFPEQIREKSQVLLGIQSANKKKIGNMYDFRSRFIHGELDFIAPFLGVESKSKEDFSDVLSESTGLAIAILIATFQALIQRGWSGLQFSYVVGDLSK
jgi:hypothetical protein